MRLIKEQLDRKKNIADIDQREGYSFYTYNPGSVVLSCQNIDEIYPISECDTLYFEVCIFSESEQQLLYCDDRQAVQG